MSEMKNPIIVEFPVRGEWLAPNTPGTKIPSHGTNQLGTRYAYDFVQVNWSKPGFPAYNVGFLKYVFFGVLLKDYYCYGKEIYAPCDGEVVAVQDGYKEKERTNLFLDTFSAHKNSRYFDPNKGDIQTIAGNYIIIKYADNIFAALCHLQTKSVKVSVGQKVKKGNIIGNVGHSGNSFAPHLHFQMMDRLDIAAAKGLPCAFAQYEVFKNDTWIKVINGVPLNKDRIRFGV